MGERKQIGEKIMPFYTPSCDIDYDVIAIVYDYSDKKYHTQYYQYKKVLWWNKLVLVRESVSK